MQSRFIAADASSASGLARPRRPLGSRSLQRVVGVVADLARGQLELLGEDVSGAEAPEIAFGQDQHRGVLDHGFKAVLQRAEKLLGQGALLFRQRDRAEATGHRSAAGAMPRSTIEAATSIPSGVN